MAYQPIQVPRPGMFDAMDAFGEKLVRARQMQIQQDQWRARMLHDQRMQDEIERANLEEEAWRKDKERRYNQKMKADTLTEAAKFLENDDPMALEQYKTALAGVGLDVEIQPGQAVDPRAGQKAALYGTPVDFGGTQYNPQDLEQIGEMSAAMPARDPDAPMEMNPAAQARPLGMIPGPGGLPLIARVMGGESPAGAPPAAAANERRAQAVKNGPPPAPSSPAPQPTGPQPPQPQSKWANELTGMSNTAATVAGTPQLAAGQPGLSLDRNKEAVMPEYAQRTPGSRIIVRDPERGGQEILNIDQNEYRQQIRSQREQLARQMLKSFPGEYGERAAEWALAGAGVDKIISNLRIMSGQDATLDQKRYGQALGLQGQMRGQEYGLQGAYARGPIAGGRELGYEKQLADLEQEAWTRAETVMRPKGYAKLTAGDQKINEMLFSLTGARDNSALATLMAGAFAKYAQGQTGVLSDSDLRVFWERMGGVSEQAMQKLQGYVSGTLTLERATDLREALELLRQGHTAHVLEIGGDVENAIMGSNSAVLRSQADPILRALFRPYWDLKQKGETAPVDTPAGPRVDPRAVKIGGGKKAKTTTAPAPAAPGGKSKDSWKLEL